MSERKSPEKASELTPLLPLRLEILLLLNDREMHGYGIMSELNGRNQGSFVLGPGTLYRNLKEMKETGLIERSSRRRAGDSGNERRQYYAITSFGRQVAAAEARRMARLVRTATLGGLLSEQERS
ncbi:MAG TPA: helix-turn-helix transcriptional regulator [Acidobacteriota bacterium]|nr:helix-turn-helix transcriptional regulator [Acidobacteriota bacterium]